jgi:hypothetical protein
LHAEDHKYFSETPIVPKINGCIVAGRSISEWITAKGL